jgi:hypothetical protein
MKPAPASSRRSSRRGPLGGPTPFGRCRPGGSWRTASDTHVTVTARADVRSSPPWRPGSLSPLSRQGDRLPRPRVPSIDECSPNPAFAGGWFGMGARHRSRRLAADDPASDALSLLAALSRGGARPIVVIHVLFARGRGGPRAARRLLQSLRSASTTTDVRTPQDHAGGRPLTQLRSRRHASRRRRAADGLRTSRSSSQSRGHGPGAVLRGQLGLALGASHRDRSRGELRPNPIGSDTSCRKLAAITGWRCRCHRAHHRGTLFEPAWPTTLFAP